MSAAELAARLDARRLGREWHAFCPAHRGKSRSLHFRDRENGGILMLCRAGCATKDVLSSLNLSFTDICPTRLRRPAAKLPQTRERAVRAWFVHDEIIRVRGYYVSGLLRTEQLEARMHDWHTLARLASVSTFFLAGLVHINRLDTPGLVRFALMAPAARRVAILGE